MPLRTRKHWKGKRLMHKDDNVMQDGKDTDVVIPIMGPTGAGKSTFINTLISDIHTVAGSSRATVGHGLKSRTGAIQHFVIVHPSDQTRRLVFVDTPGFDDTYVDDSEILRRIAVWLAKSYSDNMKLAGVIYLHEISQPRMMGTPRKNFEMFRELCGNEAVRNVVLATTKWTDVTAHVGNRREKQLKEKYWQHMLDLGSRITRFNGDHKSAWEIVNHILNNQSVDALLIQEELVEHQKTLPETAAGRALRATLKELLATQKKVAQKLQQGVGVGGEDGRLRQTYEENRRKIHSTNNQIQELKIPLPRRIVAFLMCQS
ncbi:putative 50S ribosome-binding GTPase [Lyophyllum shimeji]|uniref:50S ribosome-binding GTPase n=1 Tax=Lyophyllum shimeji TaxID=47721 RepID=A0A9P3PHD3_LYOSH|nr:putative 50S ribosome-binding GTPase [Lyophyllum shimeji]